MAIKWISRGERKKFHFHFDKKWAATGIMILIFAIAYMVVEQYGSWYMEGTQTCVENIRYWWTGKVRWIVIWMLAVAALPWIFGVLFKTIGTEKRFFRTPIEIPVIVFVFLLGYIENFGWSLVSMKGGHTDVIDLLFWAFVYGIVYWVSACFRPVYQIRPWNFFKQQTLTGRVLGWLFRKWRTFREKVKKDIESIVESWKNIDLKKHNNGLLIKLIGFNFVILLIITLLISSKITAVLVYSAILFLVLRYVYQRIRQKYGILLRATNEIAEGNLDASIDEDLWIFNPFKKELEKIQHGFKNAVEKEMQSQHMKTELITNVSHDLKTPLTAIITYVSLLKKEKDDEKRKEYIDVLERKSLRLKVLIEDLFEISKVSSNNVKLNLTDVDVVNLMKQVILELEDKIQQSKIEFRCHYPQEKTVALLDGQVTYRIFENLIVNITKYAMPGTRAYVEVSDEGGKVTVRMKNVSAEELNFNPDELTERFVRGDRSRNTEGSGLGLAIAKSFTELQGGIFKIETEADLFKVEIKF